MSIRSPTHRATSTWSPGTGSCGGLTLPLPSAAVSAGLPLISCVISFSCHRNIASLSFLLFPVPKDVVSCLFGQGLETITERGFILTFNFSEKGPGPLSKELSERSQERRYNTTEHLIRRRVSEKGEKKCGLMLLEK